MATYMNNTTERRKSCNTCLKKDIDNIKLCTGCRQVGYCSKDCQRKDWLAGHQVSCKKYAAEKENISKACTLCGKTSSNMRACTRCWKSCYCDVSCQISDLKRHRKTCHSGRAPPNPPSKTLRSSYDCSLFAPVLGCTQSELEDKLITAKRPTVELYGKVKARVRQLYPSHSLIQKFSKVPKEYEVRDARKVVLLVLIARNHPYPGRTCVYLADIKGKEYFLAFYIDTYISAITCSTVEPGKFICIPNPRFHQFIDGQIGFRVDEPLEYRILSVSECT